MNFRKVFGAFFLFSLFANYGPLQAFESDQYNLPPVRLADIGDEVSEFVEENLRAAVEQVNAAIALRLSCVENPKPSSRCGTPEKERRELAYLRSDEAIAREVFKRLGGGTVFSPRSQTWLNSHKFRGQPARYKTGYQDSIYALLPTNYFTISPTVTMYGSSFGTDKIAHIFQQGYGYYKTRREQVASGKTIEEATQKAVKQGVFSENTYFGTLVGGVFSNADLSANYAGMMFYEGLANSIRIGEIIRPASVEVTNGFWSFNEDVRPVLLRPFISDHLNEALNPSLLIPGLRSSVRRVVRKKSCLQWRNQFPTLKKQDYESQDLTQWNREDYGFRASPKFVTIANTCFD
jgi:hypothetical protein